LGFGTLFKRNKEKTKVSLEQKEKQEFRQEIEKEPTQMTQHAQKKVLVSNVSVPSGCKKYLGYLHERPEKSSKIPEECIVCSKVVNCIIQ
jgi:hypothetical protein